MNDPYKILGINSGATDDEVREAYRELSRKYHPDMHSGSPLSDVAEEKMVELNGAYDQIMDMRRGGSASNSSNASYASSSDNGGTNGNYAGTAEFSEVRRQIMAGNFTVADDMLESGALDKTAEWSFLKGSVCYGRGWLDEAYKHFSDAVRSDPSNAEYTAALNRMVAARSGNMNGNPTPYRTGNGNPDGMRGCSVCDVCQGLICADCCCNCMGGGC